MDAEQYAVESEKIQVMRQQVEATELLAYEQRTANLIAYRSEQSRTGDHRFLTTLDAEIELRMGLQ